MSPSLGNVNAVGHNGIPLIEGARVPTLYVPMEYSVERSIRPYSECCFETRKANMMHEMCRLWYNDCLPFGFSVSITEVRDRITEIEASLNAGNPVSVMDTAYWDAVYERQHRNLTFTHREAYLDLLVDKELGDLGL